MTGYEEIAVDGTVKSLNVEHYKHGVEKSQRATISVEDDQIRYRADGGNPSTTVGHLASANDVITLESFNEIQHFRVTKVTGTAELKITYA